MRIHLIIQDVKQELIKMTYSSYIDFQSPSKIETLILSDNISKTLKIRGFIDVDMKTSLLYACFGKVLW